MSRRDVVVVALGRFLVVERYRETHQPPLTHPTPSSGLDRTGGHSDGPGSTSGSRAPARPRPE